jgi:hypothetical protein
MRSDSFHRQECNVWRSCFVRGIFTRELFLSLIEVRQYHLPLYRRHMPVKREVAGLTPPSAELQLTLITYRSGLCGCLG